MADPSGRTAFLPRPLLRLGIFYFLVFVLGYQLLPVVPLHLRGLGLSLAQSGRFTSAFTVGSAAGALVTGPYGDRLGQKSVLLWASLLFAAFLSTYALLPIPWVMTALAPFHGLVWSGIRTAALTKAGNLLAPEDRARGMSLFGLAAPAGVAIGPALGLALFPLLGFRSHLLGMGLAFVALATLLRSLPGETSLPRRAGPLFRAPDPGVWLPAGVLFSLGLTFGPIPPFAAQEAVALAMPWPSALLTSLAVGMVLFRVAVGVRGLGKEPLRNLPPMLWITAGGMAMLALLPGGCLRHALGGAVYGGGYAVAHTLLFMAIIDTCKPRRRGAGVGILYATYDVGQAAGVLIVGHVMEAAGRIWSVPMGYRVGWAVAALLLVAAIPIARRIQGGEAKRT